MDQDGKFIGSVFADELRADGAPIDELAARHPTTIVGDDALDEALGGLADAHLDWAPVVTESAVVGIISTRDVMAAYRQALAGNVRKVRGITTGSITLETLVTDRSSLRGRRVVDIPWPRGALLVGIQRDEKLIVPSGAVTLEAGDRISVLLDPAAEQQVRTLLDGARATNLSPASIG